MIKKQLSALSSIFLSLMLLGTALAQQFDAATRTITVSPSGGDDTAALQAALDSCVAFGPGCTVQLTEGIFKSQQLVSYNFHGTLKGAGMNATVLEPFGILTVTTDDPVLSNPPSLDNPWPHFVTFVDSHITISDLTLRVTEPEPTTPWIIFDTEFTRMAGVLLFTGSKADVVIERIMIEGAEDDAGDVNTYNAFYGNGNFPDAAGIETGVGTVLPLSGRFSVRDSIFRKVFYGTPFFNVVDSQIAVRNNLYEDIRFIGMDLMDVQGSSVDISHNTMTDVRFFGIELRQGEFLTPEISNSFLIYNNSIEVMDGYAIGLIDPQDTDTLQALISGNTLRISGDAVAVLGSGGHRAVIMDNTVQGSGQHAFKLGVADDEEIPVPSTTGWVISGNDLSELSTSEVAVMLGEGSGNTTVICSSSATVMDAGTGNTVLCD